MADQNPFASEEAWEVWSGFLPAGDHICNVREIDGSGTSSGGHPQVEIKVGNGQGEIRDWIVVIPKTIGKVVQFTDSVGLDRPTDEQVVPDGTGFRLAPGYLAKAVDREVGVLVRSEADRLDPSKTRERIQGYCEPSKIAPSDVTPSSYTSSKAGQYEFPSAAAAADKQNADDKIPFHNDGFPSYEKRREHRNR